VLPGHSPPLAANDVGGNVNAVLDGQLQIEKGDLLRVQILQKSLKRLAGKAARTGDMLFCRTDFGKQNIRINHLPDSSIFFFSPSCICFR